MVCIRRGKRYTNNVVDFFSINRSSIFYRRFSIRLTFLSLIDFDQKIFKNRQHYTQIFTLLKSLCISQKFVYPTIQYYNKMGDIVNCPHAGCPRTTQMPKVVAAVQNQIRRNPLCKQKVLAQAMKISPLGVSCVLRDDLHLRGYKRCTGHLLIAKLKEIRHERSKKNDLRSSALVIRSGFCSQMRRFLPLKSNLISKMIVFMLDLITKLVRKYPEYNGVIILPT